MRKILVIDDEVPTLDMLDLFLSAWGYTVLVAENEAGGMEIFQRERPGIVLTDIKMPGKDGLSILKRIKEISPATEVIVITGHGDKDLAQRAFALRASGFLNKPLDTAKLNEALKRAEEHLGQSPRPDLSGN